MDLKDCDEYPELSSCVFLVYAIFCIYAKHSKEKKRKENKTKQKKNKKKKQKKNVDPDQMQQNASTLPNSLAHRFTNRRI